MIRPAVTISLVPEARGGPFVFWDDLPDACREASRLGFAAVEVFPPGPDAIDPNEFRKLLEDRGLRLAAVGTGAGWVKHRLHLTLPDASLREMARHYVRGIIDFAGPLGAPAIIGSMQGRAGEGADRVSTLETLASALGELGEHARQYGVPLLFEPLNRYETNMANTIADGLWLVERAASGNVRLLADLFHMNIEEADIAASLVAAASHLGHLHFVDSNRKAAGFGHIEYGPIVSALQQIGYDGYASAEALPWPEPATAASRTIETFRNVFGGGAH